jgi:hypothetical protein
MAALSGTETCLKISRSLFAWVRNWSLCSWVRYLYVMTMIRDAVYLLKGLIVNWTIHHNDTTKLGTNAQVHCCKSLVAPKRLMISSSVWQEYISWYETETSALRTWLKILQCCCKVSPYRRSAVLKSSPDLYQQLMKNKMNVNRQCTQFIGANNGASRVIRRTLVQQFSCDGFGIYDDQVDPKYAGVYDFSYNQLCRSLAKRPLVWY